MKRLPILFVLLVVIALGGCETIKGMGRDIQHAGEALEDSVR